MAYNLPSPIVVSDGGTGRQSSTAYAVICGGTTSTAAQQSIAGVGSSGQLLTSNGAGALPTFQAAPSSGSWVFLQTATASNSAAITFTGLTSTYSAYKVFISNLAPITDATNFYMRTSTNNGSSYDSGASDYAWVVQTSEMATSPTQADTGDNADSEMQFSNSLGNASNEVSCWEITIYNPSAAAYCQITVAGQVTNPTPARFTLEGAGVRLTAADVDAIQFLMSSGNISAGTFKLYGITAA